MRNTTHLLAGALFALAVVMSGCAESATSNNEGAPSLAINSARLSLAPATANLVVGFTTPLTVVVKDRKGRIVSGAIVAWSSASPAVATVSSTGVVTGVSAGSVALTATYGYFSASMQMTVVTPTTAPPAPSAVTSLVVSPNLTTIAAGATQQFTVTGRRTGDPNTPVPVTVTFTATGGAVSPTGLYTAGTTAGSGFAVTATLPATTTDPSVSGAAAVTVQVTVTGPPAALQVGVWTNVTPGNVDLRNTLSCSNYGTENVQVDPNRPSDVYAQFHCQGIWKSVDYGKTWVGPINTGVNGSTVSDCAGGIRLAPNGAGNPPILYQACIRGAAMGFWRSLDGGVNWTRYTILSAAGRQDVYPPNVDPYDVQHLVMAGHEMDLIVESVDGGQHWTNVVMAPGMKAGNGTGSINFINTGNATTTRSTWLWMSQQSGGLYGTWRTTNGGATWTQVDKNEHPHGFAEIYQPDASGVVFMAGQYSNTGGAGVLRSTDYGVTWTHLGRQVDTRVIIGTTKGLYSSYGFPSGLNTSLGPNFQLAAQPGTGTWSSPATPPGMMQGASQIATGFDGTHNFLISANYGAGLWLYIEP